MFVSATAMGRDILMPALPAVGTRVSYRLWELETFHTGTIVRYWNGALGGQYADIARDGYNETAVMPVSKLADPALVTDAGR